MLRSSLLTGPDYTTHPDQGRIGRGAARAPGGPRRPAPLAALARPTAMTRPTAVARPTTLPLCNSLAGTRNRYDRYSPSRLRCGGETTNVKRVSDLHKSNATKKRMTKRFHVAYTVSESQGVAVTVTVCVSTRNADAGFWTSERARRHESNSPCSELKGARAQQQSGRSHSPASATSLWASLRRFVKIPHIPQSESSVSASRSSVMRVVRLARRVVPCHHP